MTEFSIPPSLGMYGDDGVGQYFFNDFAMGADNTEYFTALITLNDELAEGHLDELRASVCLLNYFTPYGACVLSPENEITFKYTVLLKADMEQAAAEEYLDLVVSHALEGFRRHIHLLISVVNGELTPDDIVELYDTSEEE